jgi:glutaminase
MAIGYLSRVLGLNLFASAPAHRSASTPALSSAPQEQP